MKIETWLRQNTHSLSGRLIAVTGTTGGIGRELCDILASLGASLILMDRSEKRSAAFRDELLKKYPNISVTCIGIELSDMESVKEATDKLISLSPDTFIHNAGAYSIPRETCATGYDNVFQINFVSPYYIIRKLLPTLKEKRGQVEIMGSIAHRYSKTRKDDVDFSKESRASRVYGNAKRYLMFSIFELMKDEADVSFSVVHPGITFTNITAHYPKVIFAIIKHPMKIIFQSPRRASLGAVLGLFKGCGYNEWIGPRLFDVWGLPAKKRLKGVSEEESLYIGNAASEIYYKLN